VNQEMATWKNPRSNPFCGALGLPTALKKGIEK
jgi:hypothetical protein